MESIIYPKNISTASTNFGNRNELRALQDLQVQLQIEIHNCGMFIDEEYDFLAASPDGVIGDDAIAEVKCIYSSRDLHPHAAAELGKIKFWKIDGTVNKNHPWYYQIQGQLHITKKAKCFFGTWTPIGIKLEIIHRDDTFWNREMKQKLTSFYLDCILPELADPRKTRNMEIRDPDYIVHARTQYENKKRRKPSKIS